jgi:hypothetical protein
MYIKLNNSEYYKYDVIDLNTGVRIPGVQEANDETGDFTIIMKDTYNGDWISKFNPRTQEFDLIGFHFHGNIKIVKKEE